MFRWKSSLLAFALAVGAFAQQGGSPLSNPQVRHIGEKLKCLCGCKATVTGCDMMGCHFADPARHKIAKLINGGSDEQTILASFVKDNGLQVLMAPPRGGFFEVGWNMGIATLIIGAVIVYFAMRRRLARPAPASASAAVPDPLLERYRDHIEKEMAKLE